MKECLLRELEEETGITQGITDVVKTDLVYQFEEKGFYLTEYVFSIELPKEISPELSDEHTEFAWVSFEKATEMLLWDKNKDAFQKVHKLISKN